MNTIISVLNQKGGAGKSTTTMNLSYFLQMDINSGKIHYDKIVIIDTDPQCTTYDFFHANSKYKNSNPGLYLEIECKVVNTLQKLKSWSKRISRKEIGLDSKENILYIIDGASKQDIMFKTTAKLSHLVIIPLIPSDADVESTIPVLKYLSEICTHSVMFVNNHDPNDMYIKKIKEDYFSSALSSPYNHFIESRIHKRVILRRILDRGLMVAQVKPSNMFKTHEGKASVKSSQEFSILAGRIVEILKTITKKDQDNEL